MTQKADHNDDEHTNLAWLDLETTGLDESECSILELGIVITNRQLDVLAECSWVTFPTRMINMQNLEPFIWDMHQANGLWNELFSKDSERVPLKTAVESAIEFMRQFGAIGSPMCGNTISFDRGFVKKLAPKLNEVFHYRNLDVSSIKNMLKLFYPDHRPWKPPEYKAHRAIEDLHNSIEEMSHYLDMLPLGPEPLLYEPEPAKEVSNETRAVEYILSAKESESASDYTMGAIELAREISP